MTFDIGSQQAGVINNVGGDQQINGGQYGSTVTLTAARDAGRQLRAAVAAAPLLPDAAASARRRLDDLDAELGRAEPRKPAVAEHLSRLTRLLAAAGSLTSGAAGLAGPVQTLVSWLGRLGEPIARLVPPLS